MSEKASTFRGKQEWGLPNLSPPFWIQYGELEPLVPKFLGIENIGGGFFPKMDEKYGDGDREYNWWGCSNSTSKLHSLSSKSKEGASHLLHV